MGRHPRVLVALQWLGLKKYAADNAELIDEVRVVSPTGWWLTLDWDLAQVKGRAGFEFFKNGVDLTSLLRQPAEMEEAFLKGRQTDKDEVFFLC